MELSQFLENTWIKILLIVCATLLLQILSRLIISRLVKHSVRPSRYETRQDERKREATLTGIFQTTFAALLWIMSVITILSLFSISLGSLAAGAGVFSVIIGFGAQNTIRDFLAGIFILIEHQYRVGDKVTLSGGAAGINGAKGTVEDISLRITKLRGDDGTLSIVRNGEATIIANHSFRYSNVIVDFQVHYTTDVDKLEKTINTVGQELLQDEKLQKDILEPIIFEGISKFSDSYLDVQAKGKVKPDSQEAIASEYRRRLLPALKAAKIGIHTDKKQQ